jgi:hypothetical protein
MRLRDRLASPWLTASLSVVVLALVGSVALATGLVTLPSIQFDFFALATPGPAAGPTPSPSPMPTPAEATFVRPTPSPEATFEQYTVQARDTLTSIAKAYRTTARSIAWWNRGTYPSLDPESPTYKPDSIRAGWVLVILRGQVVDENNPPTASPAPETPRPVAT